MEKSNADASSLAVSFPDSKPDVESFYKGSSPAWAALTNGITYAAMVVPFTWAGMGAAKIGFDKLFRKISMNENTWSRFTSPFGKSVGVIVGGLIAYDAYQDGKKSYREAEAIEGQFNLLSAERHNYRNQLVNAGIEPHDVIPAKTMVITSRQMQKMGQAVHDQRAAGVAFPSNQLDASTVQNEKLAATSATEIK